MAPLHTIKPSRPGLTLPLQVVLLLWSTFLLLIACKRPLSLIDEPSTQASIVNWAGLTEESDEKTFQQFFSERGASDIWNQLLVYFTFPKIFGEVYENILDNDTQIKDMLSQYLPEEQADLRAAISLYINRRNQLCLFYNYFDQFLPFRKLLVDNGLYAVWDRIEKAKTNQQARLDLRGKLQNCTPALQIQILENVFHFIEHYFPGLVQLHLSGNRLTGLPDYLGNLTQLNELYLGENQLAQLPDYLGSLTQLKLLLLNDNQLIQLPDTFGNLTQLNELNLSRNHLIALPNSFGNLTQLQVLNLGGNQLIVLPDSFGDLTQVQRLELSGNHLIALPDSFGNLIHLQIINLGGNQLTQLPNNFGNLTQLKTLYLFNNQLTQLPDSFGNLINLNELYLNSNQLRFLPGSFQKLKNLRVLMLAHNSLLPPNANLNQIGVLLTSNNLHTLLFHSLTDLAVLCIIHNNIPYNTKGNLTLPHDCISRMQNPKTYRVMLFITQQGDLTLSQPIPIITDLSYEKILDQVRSGKEVILIKQ